MTTTQIEEMHIHQETIIPLEWTSWDPIGTLANMYYKCKFTEDYGPFIAGKHYESIFIDYGKGVIESYTNNGKDVEHSMKFAAALSKVFQ